MMGTVEIHSWLTLFDMSSRKIVKLKNVRLFKASLYYWKPLHNAGLIQSCRAIFHWAFIAPNSHSLLV